MSYRIILLLLICAFTIQSSFSQNLGSISGKVLDAKTKESLPGATVYLANTAIGIIANTDGSFSLNAIHPGKYNLTVSMIGYKLLSKSVVLDGNSITGLIILLEPKVEELSLIHI